MTPGFRDDGMQTVINNQIMPHPAWISHSLSFCVGAALTAAAGIVLQTSSSRADRSDDSANDNVKQHPFRFGATAVLASREDDAATTMLPLLNTRIYQPNNDLTIAFDTRSKNPLFVMERMANNQHHQRTMVHPDNDYISSDDEIRSGVAVSRRNKRFHEEHSLRPYHRSRNQYYRNSGYDRGHLAPAADFAHSDKKMNDTFVLTNASPQLPRFNRAVWLRLEEFVRKVASGKRSTASSSTDDNTETWVITGPLWLPSSTTRHDSSGEDIFHYSYEGIGKPPSLIAVPTHFFKVVVVVERPLLSSLASSSSLSKQKKDKDAQTTLFNTASFPREDIEEMILKEFAAFVIPNAEIMGANGSFRLVDHIVRLTDLEAVSGLEFFPALFGTNHSAIDSNNNDTTPLQKEIADALTDNVRFRDPNTDKRDDYNRRGNEALNALVPLSARDTMEQKDERRKKIQKILRENSSIPFRHLCENNELCYKILNS